MKKLIVGLALLLAGCSRSGNGQAPAPSCNESTFPSEQLIREFDINGVRMIYGFCEMDDFEADRLSEGATLLDGFDYVYRLSWGANVDGMPLLMIREQGRNLYGIPQLRADLVMSRPLTVQPDLERIALVGGAERFSLDTESFHLNIVNGSEEVISMGTDFRIEFFDGKDWMELPMSPDWAFTLPLYVLKPGDIQNLNVWLDTHRSIVFDYVPGLYRVRKEIFLGDSPVETPRHELVFEFELY